MPPMSRPRPIANECGIVRFNPPAKATGAAASVFITTALWIAARRSELANGSFWPWRGASLSAAAALRYLETKYLGIATSPARR